MAARWKKRHPLRTKRQRSQELQPHEHLELPDDAVVIPSPPGAKMSEVILEFIEPDFDLSRDLEALKKLLTAATIAWNAALVSGAEREELLREALLTAPPEARLMMRAFLEQMIQRKLNHFASNT